MVMSIMLKIHRYVGVAVRQVQVEGCCGVQVGVDGGHKLSLIITNGPTNSAKFAEPSGRATVVLNTVSHKCCVSSSRGLCDELIPRPEESYRLWWVVGCDLETMGMRRPWPTGGGGYCAKRKKEVSHKMQH
jgi:hypothetical protein